MTIICTMPISTAYPLLAQYYGQEYLRRTGVTLIVNKRAWKAVLGCNIRNNRMISVSFQHKPFKIILIQVYTPTTDAEEAELDWFSKDLQYLLSVQFSSVTQSCPTLCNPMNHSTPGLPVHHQLPESTQTHVHRVGDAIQLSHPLSSPSPPALNLSQHQSFFQWVNPLHEVAKVLEFQLQHQSFQWIPRTDLL